MPRIPPEKRFQTRCRIPSIFTPSFDEACSTEELWIDVFDSTLFGVNCVLTDTVFFTGADFLTAFFGAGGTVSGKDFFGTGFLAFVVETTFFVDAFFSELFFVLVFIREILGKEYWKSKKSVISSLLSFLFYLYYSHVHEKFHSAKRTHSDNSDKKKSRHHRVYHKYSGKM